MAAVFLHSSFRSGSTYVWNQFRQLSSTTAYYEPLHESLGFDAKRLLSLTGESWNSHHPTLDAPYFSEYRPFVEGDRVRHFAPEFSYRQFFLAAEAPQPALQSYVGMLIDHATAQGKTPVFGFSRSLGRVGWLKSHFDSFNVIVLRQPRKQWSSVIQQATTYGRPYFLTTNFLICGQNRTHPLIRPLLDVYDIPLIETSHPARDLACYEQFLSGVSHEIAYFVFFYLYLATLVDSWPVADLILDVDRLSAEVDYRSRVSLELFNRTGLAVDFSNANVNRYQVDQPDLDYAAIERNVIATLASVPGLSPEHPVLKAFRPATGRSLRASASGTPPAPATWYDRQLATLETRLAQREEDVAGLTVQIHQIRTSTSWRVTEPLRVAIDLMRRLAAPGRDLGHRRSSWWSDLPLVFSETTGFGPTTARSDDHAFAPSPLHPRKCPP